MPNLHVCIPAFAIIYSLGNMNIRISRTLIIMSTLLFAILVSAVPAGPSVTLPPPLEPVELLSQTQDPRRPWVRLRDSIIEKIWGVPKRPSNTPYHNHFPPSKVLTRYNSDVVLRFKLRDSKEVEALTDAINTLSLDVWTSTVKFVDIRLAREIVSRASR
jgi:extracellular matrix protein 14